MSAQNLHVDLNLAALCSNYFIQLQHLLDAVSLLEVGASIVTENQVATVKAFASFYPANKSRLQLQQVREVAQGWLLKSFLRDSIEATGLFLDECLNVCSVVEIAAKGKAASHELHHVFNALPLKNHKLPFPEKLSRLERVFGICSPLAPHVLSINRARNCVVHRLGLVSLLDTDQQNELVVNWITTKAVAREIETGRELVLDRPGLLIERESLLDVHWVEHQKKYRLGEQIKLTRFELTSCAVTFYLFGKTCVEAIEEFVDSHGIALDGN